MLHDQTLFTVANRPKKRPGTFEVTGLFTDSTPPTSYPAGLVVVIMVVSTAAFLFIAHTMHRLLDVCQTFFKTLERILS
jgi:hypothetical protein